MEFSRLIILRRPFSRIEFKTCELLSENQLPVAIVKSNSAVTLSEQSATHSIRVFNYGTSHNVESSESAT